MVSGEGEKGEGGWVSFFCLFVVVLVFFFSFFFFLFDFLDIDQI